MIKNQGRQYGHLTAREVNIAPWHTVAVDLIGPWKTLVNGQELEFKALTIMCSPIESGFVQVNDNNKVAFDTEAEFCCMAIDQTLNEYMERANRN